MSTENDKYSFTEQSFTTSTNQYYNLNLNQREKCSILVPVQSDSKPNNDKYCGTASTDFIVSDAHEEKGKLLSRNKSSKASALTTLNDDDFKKRWKNENTLKTINKSTLSLHISATENSDEAVASDLFSGNNVIKKEKFKSNKTAEIWEFSRNREEETRFGFQGAVYVPGQFGQVLNDQPPPQQPELRFLPDREDNHEATFEDATNWHCPCTIL